MIYSLANFGLDEKKKEEVVLQIGRS